MRITHRDMRNQHPTQTTTMKKEVSNKHTTVETMSVVLAEIARIQQEQPQSMHAQEHILRELNGEISYPFNTIPIQFITNDERGVFHTRGYRRLSYEPVRFLSASSSFFRIIHVNTDTNIAQLELLFSSINTTGFNDEQNFQVIDSVRFRRTGIFVSVDLNLFLGLISLPAVYAEEASTSGLSVEQS